MSATFRAVDGQIHRYTCQIGADPDKDRVWDVRVVLRKVCVVCVGVRKARLSRHD